MNIKILILLLAIICIGATARTGGGGGSGGSGTPGGSSPQLLYNSSGSFGGVSGSGVNSNGNVGLGSVTPGQKLDIVGNARITGTGNLYFGSDNFSSIVGSSASVPDILIYNNSIASQSTGGGITTSGSNRIHTFTTSGTFTPSFTGTVNILVVAGGGGSPQVNATNNPGPGGGGGVISNTSYAVTANTGYTVTVGAGGTASTNGQNSVFNDQTAIGGGLGGTEGSGAVAASGGSGGGGGSNNGVGGAGTASQGSAGGTTTFDAGTHRSSGGGGATAVGTNASSSQAGNGGAGFTSTITGASACYGGGGGGSADATFTAGTATCGGGQGSNTTSANAGTANTGGGAGAAGGTSGVKGGATGGSGIVIVSYSLTTPSENARFTTNGNLGIGTANPGVMLDVNGDIRTRGTNKNWFGDDNKASIAASAATTGDLKFTTNSVEAMRITSGSNVGIGTTIPGAPLHISSTIGAGAPQLIINSNHASDQRAVISFRRGDVVYGTIQAISDVYVDAANGIYLRPSSVAAMYVAPGGNVGIGTTIMVDKLFVDSGRLGLREGNFIVWRKATTNGNGSGITDVVNDASNNSLAFYTDKAGSFTEQMRLDNNGNLGIGTVNPTKAFQVGTGANSVTISSTGQYVSNTSIGAGTITGTRLIQNNGSTSNVDMVISAASGQTADIAQWTTNTPATLVNINNVGNVGIGTFSSLPNKLTVNGGVGIGTTNTDSFIATSAPSGGMIVEGNVGIGTINPGSILDLVGKLRIRGGGSVVTSGTAPTVASNDCGSTGQGTVTALSTNTAGSVTAGTLNVTSCAVTFNTTIPMVNAPFCQAQDDTNILGVKVSATTTKMTITSTTSMSGDVITWHCDPTE